MCTQRMGDAEKKFEETLEKLEKTAEKKVRIIRKKLNTRICFLL
jgi:hypothetical protein